MIRIYLKKMIIILHFKIIENNIIENIYINNNVWIEDELIIQNLSFKK